MSRSRKNGCFWTILPIVVMVGIGVASLYSSPYLKPRKIVAVNVREQDIPKITEICKKVSYQSILSIKRNQLKQQIEDDPRVEFVAVGIAPPLDLTVKLKYRQPHAVLIRNNEAIILDLKLVPFETYPIEQYLSNEIISDGNPLPILHVENQVEYKLGYALAQPQIKACNEVIQLVTTKKLSNRIKINVDRNGIICLNMDKVPQIILGDGSKLDLKITNLQTILSDADILSKPTEYIDVSNPNSVVRKSKEF